MEDRIEKLVCENDVSRLLDVHGNAWCEIACEDRCCLLTFLNGNITSAYRGAKAAECFKATVLCSSREEARSCRDEMALLIYYGYKENPSWLFPLDIEDMEKLLSADTVRYSRFEMNVDSTCELAEILNGRVAENKTVFVFARFNTSAEAYIKTLDSVLMNSEKDCDFFIQASKDESLGQNQMIVNLCFG